MNFLLALATIPPRIFQVLAEFLPAWGPVVLALIVAALVVKFVRAATAIVAPFVLPVLGSAAVGIAAGFAAGLLAARFGPLGSPWLDERASTIAGWSGFALTLALVMFLRHRRSL